MTQNPIKEYSVSEGRTFISKGQEEQDVADFDLSLLAKLVSKGSQREGYWLAELRSKEGGEIITKEIVIPSSAFNSTNKLVDHLRSAWCGGTFHFAVKQQSLPYYFEQLKAEFNERYKCLDISDTIGIQEKGEWVFSQECHIYQGVNVDASCRKYHIVDPLTEQFSVQCSPSSIADLRSKMQAVITNAEHGYAGNINSFMLTMGYIGFSILKNVFAEAFSGSEEKERQPCGSCGRKFFPESLVKHERICKTHQLKSQKRKVFNSGKQRAQGSDVPLKKTVKPGETHEHGVKITNWRQNHLDFVNAIRSARRVQKAVNTGGPLPPPPPPSINPDYVQCPSCNRRFNAKAGARHIPFCQQRTKTYGEPIKSINKRAAADVGGSKTGRGKAYYQKTIRGRDPYPGASGGGVSVYSSAFGGGGANSFNDGSLRGPSTQTPSRNFRNTTSPRRRIVSASPSTSVKNRPPLHGGDATAKDWKSTGERPVTSSSKKVPRHRTVRNNVRFSEKVETYPKSPESTPRGVDNIAVVPPYKAKAASRSQGKDFIDHYRNDGNYLATPTTQRNRSQAGLSRDQIRKEAVGGSRQLYEYERTTPVSFNNSSSFNSSGYSSDLSPGGASPIGGASPSGHQSPRLHPAGYHAPASAEDYQGSPQYSRECSFIKRENSVPASFCHDCGTQYPTQTSKFCCSCGIQRAFITPR